MKRYPLNIPVLGENTISYLTEVVEKNWLSVKGEHTKAFESAFAELIGLKHAIAVQSGTAALHTALLAMGIKKGDKVVVPSYTCGACAAAVLMTGAIPVIIDIEHETWGLDASILEDVFKKDPPKAVMLVHIYGFPAKYTKDIKLLCQKYDVLLLEDASEAHGATLDENKIGSFGDAAVFSIRSEKMIGVGEGGMILSNDEGLIQKAEYWASRAAPFRTEKDEWWQKYYYKDIGMNYLLPHLLGAVGHAQLEVFQETLEMKRSIGHRYQELFQKNDLFHQIICYGANPAFWLNMVVLDELSVDQVRDMGKQLILRGLEIRPGFWPLQDLPPFKDFGYGSFDMSFRLFHKGIVLPSAAILSKDNCRAINELFEIFLSVYKDFRA